MSVQPYRVYSPPDRFKDKSGTAATNGQRAQSSNTIRRPTNGIVLKDDTFATIQVLKGSGEALTSLYDAGSRRTAKDEKTFLEFNGRRSTDVYSNFFLQSVSEVREEKQQIMETFGDAYIFFFGQKARMIQFQGVLLNTWDFNWEAEWWANYDEFLRGTRCVENDARLYIQYDNVLVGGYILNSQAQKSSEQRNFVPFSFTLFVTDYVQLSNPMLGDKSAQKWSKAWEGGKKEISGNDLYLARPQLIDSGFTNANVGITFGPDGKVNTIPMGLSPTTRSGLNGFVDSWKSGIAAVNRFFDTVNQVINGTVVRVPHGYTGSFAYDEDALTTLRPIVNKDTIISYSTFADNEEEYVSSSDHYQGSALPPAYSSPTEDESFSSAKMDRFMLSQGITDLPDAQGRSASWLVTASKIVRDLQFGLQVAHLGYQLAGLVSNARKSNANENKQRSVPDSTAPWSRRRYANISNGE